MEQQHTPHHHAPHEAETATHVSNTPKKSLIGIPAAIITGAVIIALAVIFTLGKNAPAPTTAQQGAAPQAPETPKSVPAEIATIRDGDYVRGSAQAEVVIFEYSDSDCPFCARFHPTLQSIVDQYKGRVAWVYRNYPLTMLHPNAYTEALALECAGKLGGATAYNNYLDTIINVTINADAESNKQLLTIATGQGLNADKLKTCMKDPATTQKIDASIAEAQQIGAQGTPFSVAVNVKTGKQVVIPGAYPYEDVKKDIDGLLK